jgi:hypothetical protein
MKHHAKIFITGLFSLILVLSLCGTGLSADMASISGKITAENELVADDGQVYNIADTEGGQDLLQNVDKMVEVKGTVSEKDGKKEITVNSFKVVE